MWLTFEFSACKHFKMGLISINHKVRFSKRKYFICSCHSCVMDNVSSLTISKLVNDNSKMKKKTNLPINGFRSNTYRYFWIGVKSYKFTHNSKSTPDANILTMCRCIQNPFYCIKIALVLLLLFWLFTNSLNLKVQEHTEIYYSHEQHLGWSNQKTKHHALCRGKELMMNLIDRKCWACKEFVSLSLCLCAVDGISL